MKHPAKFSEPILNVLDGVIPEGLVLDPFAGTGRVHTLARPGRRIVGVEIEPEWAVMRPGTIVGDALRLPFGDGTVDCVATSPTYANRMADHHDAKDGSKRLTYRHTLGRPLHPNNSGQLQWGKKYRVFHRAAWAEADRVLGPASVFVLNISDHIRRGKVVPVAEWHRATICGMGWTVCREIPVETDRMGFGANADVRVDHEMVYVFKREDHPHPA